MTRKDFVDYIVKRRNKNHVEIAEMKENLASMKMSDFPNDSIAEYTLAMRKLEECTMWLGKCLAPYDDITGFKHPDVTFKK